MSAKIDGSSLIPKNTSILPHSIINKCIIGDYSYIGENCIIQNTTFGNYCSVANNVIIGPGQHPIQHFSTSPVFYRKNNPTGKFADTGLSNFEEFKPIQIGHDTWIGCNVVIMDGITIGNGAIIAAGSIVTKSVPDFSIVGGVPAKIIKSRFTEEKVSQLNSSQWWNYPPEKVASIVRMFKSTI
ncbi:MAG: CatB-related O-acetyltransferase [Puniceicoccales bacterium]